MIKSISLENFMSHQATLIELAPGVTVLTGPNNVGKSALVEAVRSLVHNSSQKHSIRHGAKQAVVRLELDSGEIIEWVRSEKTAFYRLLKPQAGAAPEDCEVEEYHKIDRKVPEDLAALLRLGAVETENDEDIDIHIGNQRAPIFLLNRPGSHAAGFFAASTEAEYLLRMQQALKKRMDVAKATKKMLTQDCAAAEKELLRYQPLNTLEPELGAAETAYELICRNRDALPQLLELIRHLAEQEQLFHRNKLYVGVLETLPDPPELMEVAALEVMLQHRQEREAQAGLATARSRALAQLAGPPPLKETGALDHLAGRLSDTGRLLQKRRQEEAVLLDLAEAAALKPVGDLEALTRTFRRLEMALAANRGLSLALQEVRESPPIHDLLPLEQVMEPLRSCLQREDRARRHQEILAPLHSPPDLADEGDLLRLIGFFSQTRARWLRQETLTVALAPLAAAPELMEIKDLQDLIARMAGVREQLSRKRQELHSLDEALDQKRLEVEQLIRETGLCPLCGSPMDVSHFLEALHA